MLGLPFVARCSHNTHQDAQSQEDHFIVVPRLTTPTHVGDRRHSLSLNGTIQAKEAAETALDVAEARAAGPTARILRTTDTRSFQQLSWKTDNLSTWLKMDQWSSHQR